MSRPKAWLSLFLVLPVLLLPACQLGGNRDADDLRGILYRYEAAVRWGDLRKAYAFLKPGTQVQVPAGLENIRVTAYETVNAAAPESEGRWSHTVSIQYLHRDRQQVKTLIDRQIWIKDAEGEFWYRDNPIPAFP